MKITLRRLGMKTGAEALKNIGASCDLLIIEVNSSTHNYMVDCGMGMNDDAELSWQGPMEIGALANYPLIDGILITHGHRDHAGAIPLKIVREHPHEDAWIMGTTPTINFLPFVWHDQCKVSGKRREKLPYGQFDIHKLRKRFRAIPKPQVVELVAGTIWVLVWPSAHIRGACSYIFKIREGSKEVKIMFSGDYCCHNQLTTAAAPLPPDDLYPDILANFDCTNGAEDLARGTDEATFWQREMERMADDGHQTVKGGGDAFFYSFAMDRSPTFARKLNDLGLPVWLDGPSAIELTRRIVAAEGIWCPQDLAFNLGSVRVTEWIFQPLELQDREPCAIVAPGGMGHGPAIEYFKHFLPRENCLVASSGYQAHGTNGWRIGETPRGGKVRLEVDSEESLTIPIAARTEQYRATAHALRGMAAERMEVLLSRSQFLKSGTPVLGFTHGSSKAFDWFERRLSGIKTFRADRPEDREIILVDF